MRHAWSILVAGLAIAVVVLRIGTMPHPYEAVLPVPIAAERIERMPSMSVKRDFVSRVKSSSIPLDGVVRLFEGQIEGAESIGLTSRGDVIMLDKYGYVFRARKNVTSDHFTLENPEMYIGPGRPLGFHILSDDDESLLVCDSLKGLLRVNLRLKTIEILSNSVEGEPLNYANDLDVARDGNVYFSSSTELPVALSPLGFYDTMRSFLLNAMRGDCRYVRLC